MKCNRFCLAVIIGKIRGLILLDIVPNMFFFLCGLTVLVCFRFLGSNLHHNKEKISYVVAAAFLILHTCTPPSHTLLIFALNSTIALLTCVYS